MWVLLSAPFLIGSLILNNILRYEGKAFYAMIGLVTGALLFTEEEKAENRKKRLTCAEAKKKALSGRLHSEAERVMTGLEEDFDEGARLMEAMRIYESSGIAAFLHEKDHEEEV